MSALLEGITWMRGSSVLIERDGLVVYVDPTAVGEPLEADYVLLTHPHFDIFSEEDIARVRSARSVLIAPATMKKQIADAEHLLRPGDMLQLQGIDVLAVPAYNTEKKFHPQGNEWLGYVFTIGDVTYYHAGDTDYLDSMKDIRCDVAFLPCGGQYTMGPEEAAQAAIDCEARVVVPIHWGETRADADRLAELLPGRVQVLERAG